MSYPASHLYFHSSYRGFTLKYIVLFQLENIAGKLVFYQTDGNATYERDTGELAADIPTEAMFQLFDPQKNFSSATFTYTWDLGNGYEEFSCLKHSQRFGGVFFYFHGYFSLFAAEK